MTKVRVKFSWYKKTSYLPKSWDDLNPSSLEYICQVLLSNDEITARLHILRRLLGMRKRDFNRLTEGQLFDLLQCIDFITLASTTQIFKSFKNGWTLPSDQFRDGTCYEYAKAEFYQKKFKETGDSVHLDLFFATLARHQNFTTNSEATIKQKVKKLRRVPPYIKMVTLCYFLSVKNLVADTYGQFLFQSGLDQGSSYKPRLNLEWWGAYNSVAESGVFGSVEKVYAYNFFDVCTYLAQKKEQFLEAQAKQQAHES